MSLEFLEPGPGEHLDYRQVWELQRSLHSEVASGARGGTVLLLEHAPVYTAGKRTEPHERPLDQTPVVDVDRGGKITWHGPGQLVAYPIVRLPEAVYVVDYVRRLEEAVIRMLADYELTTGRVPGRSGVWLAADQHRPQRKVAAIGVRVASKTTLHGVAVNVDVDLSWFDRIIPCGISDAGVTSMAVELGRPVNVDEAAGHLRTHLAELLAFQPYEKSPDLGVGMDGADPGAGITYGLAVGG
jgi:lipoyl(octanoyl) transferase